MLPRLKAVYFEQTRPVVSSSSSSQSNPASTSSTDQHSGELQLYTNPICRALSYRKDINDLLPNLQNLDGWPTERLEVKIGSNGGGGGVGDDGEEKTLISIQEAFSDLDSLVDAKKGISGGNSGGNSGEGDAFERYLDRLCDGVKPWVESGFWNLNGEGASSGQNADHYVDSVDKDLANVLRQCKKVCEKGKELREGLT